MALFCPSALLLVITQRQRVLYTRNTLETCQLPVLFYLGGHLRGGQGSGFCSSDGCFQAADLFLRVFYLEFLVIYVPFEQQLLGRSGRSVLFRLDSMNRRYLHHGGFRQEVLGFEGVAGDYLLSHRGGIHTPKTLADAFDSSLLEKHLFDRDIRLRLLLGQLHFVSLLESQERHLFVAINERDDLLLGLLGRVQRFLEQE